MPLPRGAQPRPGPPDPRLAGAALSVIYSLATVAV